MTGTGSTTAPTTEELLARLPPLPRISKPFFGGEQQLRESVDDVESAQWVELMLSGRLLDDLLAEVLDALPEVAAQVAEVGGAGLRLQARPSNSINALTVPTADGVIVVYNLGLYGLLYSVAVAASVDIGRAGTVAGSSWDDVLTTVDALSLLVDWATSLAAEPRTGPTVEPDRPLPVDDDISTAATRTAGPAQRFALCHELGHVLALRDERASLHTATTTVEGVPVEAIVTSHEREFDADRRGLDLALAVLAARGGNPVDTLVGVEVFLNTVAMMHPFTDADGPTTHPDPDERLFRLRQHYLARTGEAGGADLDVAIAFRGLLEAIRSRVVPAVTARRARVTRALEADVAAYAARVADLDVDGRRAAAKALAFHLLASPGATLEFLHAGLSAPQGADEPDTGSPERLLLLDAARHLEAPLQAAIGLRT